MLIFRGFTVYRIIQKRATIISSKKATPKTVKTVIATGTAEAVLMVVTSGVMGARDNEPRRFDK